MSPQNGDSGLPDRRRLAPLPAPESSATLPDGRSSARSPAAQAIHPDEVAAVLLPDGWHACTNFAVGASGLDGGESAWFVFVEDLDDNAGSAYRGRWVTFSGPVSSILALRAHERAA